MNAGDFANSLYRNGGSGAGRSDPAFSKPPTAAQLQAKKASALSPYAPGPARTARSPWPVQSYIQNFKNYLGGLDAGDRQQSSGLVPDGTTANQLALPKYQRREAAGNSPGFYNIQGGRVDPRYQHGMPQGTATRSPQSSRMGSSSRGSSAPNMSAFSPGQAQPRQQSLGTPYGQPQFNPQSLMLPGFGGGPQMRTVNFDGSVTKQPNFALRDAFAQNINSAMTPYYQNSGTYLGEGAPPPTWGQAPQFNFPQLYGQATNMVADGYQNPLAGLFG